jgi:isopenicillin-N epimerase
MSDPVWSDAREQMLLDAAVINLNTGSFGPLPRPVFERVTELRRQLAAGPMDFLVRRMPPQLWDARRRLAAFLGADPRRLLFTANVTASINLVASSLRLAAPGEVLLTDHEYGSMHWTWERACRRQGLTLRTFPLPTMAASPQEIVDAATAAMTERTRLFFFSHVLSPTGLVLPAKEMCAAARARGILTAIDGAHAPAMLPLDLDAVGADFYGSNCHKWLLAPTGSGFLYFAPGAAERVAPLQVSWGWHPDRARLDEPDEYGTTPRLRHLEFEGTRDPCPWIATASAVDFQAALGFDRVRRRMRELAAYSRRRIGGIGGLAPATPEHPALHGAMVAFQLPPGHDPDEVRRRIWEHRIEVNVIEQSDRLLLRTSTHFYNDEQQLDCLAAVLPGVLGRA